MYRHFRNLTITQRLFALTALAMLPAVVVVIFYISSLQEQREREVQVMARQYGQLARLEIERIVSGAEGTLQALANTEDLRRFNAQACGDYLAAVNRDLPHFLGIFVADATGQVRCSSTGMPGVRNVSDRSYFNQAIETGRFVIGASVPSVFDDQPTLPLALPMPSQDDAFHGLVVADLDLAWLGRQLRERMLLEGSTFTVADRNGVIIAHEPDPEGFVGTTFPDAYQDLVRSDRAGTREIVSEDGIEQVLQYYPPAANGAGLYVGFGIPAEAAFGDMKASIYRSVVIAVVGGVFVFIIVWMAGERLFRRPIRRLLDTVSAWRRGDDSARTNLGDGSSEIAVLAAAIDEYMDELTADRAARRRAEQHRVLLVRELDHRVKNILTTVQAIASQSFRSEQSRAGLEAFSGRLAAMASTHEMLMSENWATAELRRTLELALKPFDEADQSRFTLQGPLLMIRARAALTLSMAMHELCTNAVKYGALSTETGRIIVEWSSQRQQEDTMFTLRWSERGGPPVSPPERSGFGTRMIERALAAELSARIELEFPPTGLVCTLQCALPSILVEETSSERAA